MNCYLYEEGNSQVGSEKAIYCRNQDNLPKITIGLRQYILTLGKSNFYKHTTVYIHSEFRIPHSELFLQVTCHFFFAKTENLLHLMILHQSMKNIQIFRRGHLDIPAVSLDHGHLFP